MADLETGIRGDLEWGTIPALARSAAERFGDAEAILKRRKVRRMPLPPQPDLRRGVVAGVAAGVVDLVMGKELTRTVDDPAQNLRSLAARQVVTDATARYVGAVLNDQSRSPGDNPRIAPTHFEDWLSRSMTAARS